MSGFKRFLTGKKGGEGSGTSLAVVRPTAAASTASSPNKGARMEQYRLAGASAPQLRSGKFALVLDGTGSMGDLLSRVKQSLHAIEERVVEAAPEASLTFQVIVYRDYMDDKKLELSPEVSHLQDAQGWLARVVADGGGDFPEAVELGLAAVLQKGGFSAVLLAGDACSNTKGEIISKSHSQQRQTAHELAERLGKSGVPVHTLVVGGDPSTAADFATIAQLSGGVTGELLVGDDSAVAMMATAMLKSIGGTTAVEAYLAKYKVDMSPKALEFTKKLLQLKQGG